MLWGGGCFCPSTDAWYNVTNQNNNKPKRVAAGQVVRLVTSLVYTEVRSGTKADPPNLVEVTPFCV